MFGDCDIFSAIEIGEDILMIRTTLNMNWWWRAY